MKRLNFLLIGVVNLLLMTPLCTLAQTHNGHEYVDLGLSVKWATCNVGSYEPEDYGDYFAWGETSYKSTYARNNYKFLEGEDGYYRHQFTKYNERHTRLDPQDDVAHVKWGGDWYLPSVDECKELIENCTWTWVTQNGRKGIKGTSKKNGNSIFLPASDSKIQYHWGEPAIEHDEGFYLTNTLDSRYDYKSAIVWFREGGSAPIVDGTDRYGGYTARPVFRTRVQPMETSKHVGHTYVDLGLSVKWATCNLGANSHEEGGDTYAWGEIEPSIYDGTPGWDRYKWSDEDGVKMKKYNTIDNITKLELQDDAAHVKWGGNWRIPSYDEWCELFTNCDGKYVTQNGESGLLLTSKRNGNTIFIPSCAYWTNSLYTKRKNFAFSVSIYEGMRYTLRDRQYSIRPICP